MIEIKNLGQKVADALLATPERLSSAEVSPLDVRIPIDPKNHNGTNYIGVYHDIRRVLHQCGDDRTLLLVLPLPSTNQAQVTPPLTLDIKLDPMVSASFYLRIDNNFLIEAEEEYRKYILYDPSLKILFRSWRDCLAAEKDWEFNNDMFVWPAD